MKKLVLSAALIAMGSFAMAQQTAQRVADKAELQQKHENKMQAMKQQLNLTDAQVERIQALKEKQKANHMKARESMQANGKQQYEAEMKNILTPEQYTKWQAMKAQKAERKVKLQNKDARELPNAE